MSTLNNFDVAILGWSVIFETPARRAVAPFEGSLILKHFGWVIWFKIDRDVDRMRWNLWICHSGSGEGGARGQRSEFELRRVPLLRESFDLLDGLWRFYFSSSPFLLASPMATACLALDNDDSERPLISIWRSLIDGSSIFNDMSKSLIGF